MFLSGPRLVESHQTTIIPRSRQHLTLRSAVYRLHQEVLVENTAWKCALVSKNARQQARRLYKAK